MKKFLFLASFFIFLSGCSAYKKHYAPIDPVKYPHTDNVRVFEYATSDLGVLYETLFNDYLIIGKSAFEGAYENPQKIISYAKSLGTDLLITNRTYLETVQYYETKTDPIDRTSVAQPTMYGSVASYGPGVDTRTTYTLREKKIFKQQALFLRNVNNTIPLWDKKETDYAKTDKSAFDGIWAYKQYTLSVYKSNENVVGIINDTDAKNKNYKKGDLKLIFNYNDKTGVFLDDDKKPLNAEFSYNRYGDLLVRLPKSVNISFKKK